MIEQQQRPQSDHAGQVCKVCLVHIGRSYLMCGKHWRLVPPALQREVYTTWGRVQRRRGDWKQQHADIEAYRDARDAALEAARSAS